MCFFSLETAQKLTHAELRTILEGCRNDKLGRSPPAQNASTHKLKVLTVATCKVQCQLSVVPDFKPKTVPSYSLRRKSASNICL